MALIENRSRSRFLGLANTPLIFESLALRSFSNLSPLGEGIWKPLNLFICNLSLVAPKLAQKHALRSFPDPRSFNEGDNAGERGNTIPGDRPEVPS